MTTTRSAISATTPMSWVMKSTDMCSSSCNCLMRARICAWMVTSSAVVGSSAIRMAHAARELVRVVVDAGPGLRDAHPVQQLQHLGLGGGAAEALVQNEQLRDLLADGQHRIEAGHRLLEDHGDVVAPDLLHRLLGKRQQVAPLQRDPPLDAAGAAGEQAHDRQRGDALARAGFPDDGERLLRVDVEADVAEDLAPAAARVEPRREAGNRKDRPGDVTPRGGGVHARRWVAHGRIH